jgi:hypothetical protein
LKFFLLEKALYEVEYELAYRPNWLHVPLKGTIQILFEDEAFDRFPGTGSTGAIAESTGSPQSPVKSRAQTARGAGVTGPPPVSNGRRGS